MANIERIIAKTGQQETMFWLRKNVYKDSHLPPPSTLKSFHHQQHHQQSPASQIFSKLLKPQKTKKKNQKPTSKPSKMQFTTIFTVLAMAMTAIALPATSENPALAVRTSTTPTCSTSGQNPVCCSDTQTTIVNIIKIIGGIGIPIPITIPICAVAIAGSTCSGKSACCNVQGDSGNSVIDVDILNGCNLLL
ncbi:hypothetical protein QBC38DRAFT_490407 [Podospora fimiseda]|uniref:Hydrophobin n=1 Tax=Podospora fimiseda TaxID=252190 RepID=A0AAN6YN85_9PEZI|nr:hypothetical protein QBC38DRAFT_490407 [Podospora fimiseda]